VDQQVAALDERDAALGQTAFAARQVRIRDHRDEPFANLSRARTRSRSWRQRDTPLTGE
jgi:hypothetical protein